MQEWFNPINLGGGGGAFGPHHQNIDHNSKTVLSSASKLGDFCFYLLDTFWQHFSKINSPEGLLHLFLK